MELKLSERAIGVLAASPTADPDLVAWIKSASVVLAADGGGDICAQAGRVPDYLIGDFDSISGTPTAMNPVIYDPKPYLTDCEKLLALVEKLGITELTLVNIEGGLPDHFLATLQSSAASKLSIRFVFQTGIGLLIRSNQAAEIFANGRVSLIPLNDCKGVNLHGVRWELDSVDMSPVGLKSISNEVESPGLITASLRSGVAFLFVGKEPGPFWN